MFVHGYFSCTLSENCRSLCKLEEKHLRGRLFRFYPERHQRNCHLAVLTLVGDGDLERCVVDLLTLVVEQRDPWTALVHLRQRSDHRLDDRERGGRCA